MYGVYGVGVDGCACGQWAVGSGCKCGVCVVDDNWPFQLTFLSFFPFFFHSLEIAALEPQYEKLKEDLEAREATINKQTRKINKIEDKTFKEFSAQVGVSNIREYEQKREAFEKEKAEKRLMYKNQESLLKNQLSTFLLIFYLFFFISSNNIFLQLFFLLR